jgi:uracil-DNA glycosylase family 4
MIKVKDDPRCAGCPMLKVDFKYKNSDGVEVHHKGSEQTLVQPQVGNSLRLALAEAPGEDENLEGKPLVGGSGRVMNMLWGKAGIRRDSLTILNCINCRPPNNLYPTDNAARCYISEQDAKAAVSQCYRNHVKPVLDSRPWTRVDAIGEKALRTITGKTDGIMKWRGSPLPLVGEQKEKVIGILHPSYLMRDQDMIPATISDLKKGTDVPPEHYNLNPTVDDVLSFVNAKVLCFDIETNRYSNKITMVGLSTRPYHVTVVPWGGNYIGALKQVFASAQDLVGQNNVAFDIPFLEANGVKFSEVAQVWDTMLLHHLVQPDNPHNLEFISSIFTQKPAWKHLNNENMALYCARDVDVTIQSYLQLRPLVKQLGMEDLYKYSQVPLAKICRMMHDVGVRTNPKKLAELAIQYQKELDSLIAELPPALRSYDKPIRKREPAPPGTLGKSGKPVKFIHVPAVERVDPWNSPDSVGQYLYTTLGLPKQYHPKTKRLTTDKNALERLERKTGHPVLGLLRKTSSLSTIISGFLDDDKDSQAAQGEVHANFLPHGTATGRLSSSDPNMQNITPKAKYIYVPNHDDWCWIEADFSSLENTLAAFFANDEDRLRRMNEPGFNEHKWLASKIYGIPIPEIDKSSWQYDRAKHTNHGADAGMGPRKMSVQYNIPESDCKVLLNEWKKLNWASAQWQDRTGNQAIRDGVLRNPFGRKRWFWSQKAYTEGIRMMLQGSGADICIRSMIALLYERINWPEENVLKVSGVLAPLPRPATLNVQVHDSLLVASPLNLVEECQEQMTKAMTQPWKELGGFNFKIAFKVGEPGASWGELKEKK